MTLGPNNDRWDCGGHCIHGGLVGPGRDCDACWEGAAIAAVPDAALLADICDNMAEVLKPLPGIPDAPGQHAGTRATESGDGDKR